MFSILLHVGPQPFSYPCSRDYFVCTSFRHWVRVCNMGASIRQFMTLYVAPNFYIAKDSGVIGLFYEDIARTLNRLYSLFIVSVFYLLFLLFVFYCRLFCFKTSIKKYVESCKIRGILPQ